MPMRESSSARTAMSSRCASSVLRDGSMPSFLMTVFLLVANQMALAGDSSRSTALPHPLLALHAHAMTRPPRSVTTSHPRLALPSSSFRCSSAFLPPRLLSLRIGGGGRSAPLNWQVWIFKSKAAIRCRWHRSGSNPSPARTMALRRVDTPCTTRPARRVRLRRNAQAELRKRVAPRRLTGRTPPRSSSVRVTDVTAATLGEVPS